MATTTIPLSEYLATTYRPDCDYVDGEIQERNFGELDHGSVQLFLGAFLLVSLRNGRYESPRSFVCR